MSYENKLLKYVGKNKKILTQFGGIVGEIPLKNLDEEIEFEKLPIDIQYYIKYITIPNTHIIPVGSGTLRLQRFSSDVDVMNIVEKSVSTDNLILLFIENIKDMVKHISSDNKVFFSDFKAGGLHWTADEILKEKKDNLTLKDACKILDVVKLDMFAPYNRRMVEMSTFFILKSNDGFVNVDKDYFNNFQESLFKDIQKYRNDKPFKAVKRLWSLARITNDYEIMDKLEYLINSNISLLSQINADLETLELIIQKNIKFNKEFVLDEINNFKERLEHILDLDLDKDKVSNMIDNMVLSFKFDTHERESNLTELHDYILSVINTETINYLTSIKFSLPTVFEKKPTAHDKSVFNHDALLKRVNKSTLNLSESKLLKNKEPVLSRSELLSISE